LNIISVTECNLCTNYIAGQMYMLSSDGHVDTADISVALYPPGVYTGMINSLSAGLKTG